MTILRVGITGATGQIGSALVTGLVARPELKVVAITRNRLGARLLDGAGAEVRVGSVTDLKSAALLLDDCQAVVNCAIATGMPGQARRENEAITHSVLSLPRVRTAVFLSSVAVYGTCIEPKRSTFKHPHPDTAYGREKLQLERVARRTSRRRDVRCFVIRLGHVYGPGQAISRTILDLLDTPGFALPFDGAVFSNTIGTCGVVLAVQRLLTDVLPEGTYNLADSPQRTWREVFDLHASACRLELAPRLPDQESVALREAHLRVARRSVARIASDAFGRALRPISPSPFAHDEALRRVIDSLLVRLPSRLEARIRRAYVRRVVRIAMAGLPAARPTAPAWLCSAAMPGPYVELGPEMEGRGARADMGAALHLWFHRATSWKWDPSEFGL